jgi:pyrroline-5-carboxylate reductase
MSGPVFIKTGVTDMGKAQQQTGIASELALLLVLATLWGASYTFL